MPAIDGSRVATALALTLYVSCTGNHGSTLSHRSPRSTQPPPPKPDVAASSSITPRPKAGAVDAGVDGEGGTEAPGEHWSPRHRGVASCLDYKRVTNLQHYTDPHGPKRKFGYDRYVYRQVEVSREIDDEIRRHCVNVYFPQGGKGAEGKKVHAARIIDSAWYRLIERTLARLPWLHLQEVSAFVIDNRPIKHGIAPFSREAPTKDARDGHTIWLNEHLFTRANHWAVGNYGKYWGYHVQLDRTVVDNQPADHQLFSPILLHEIGHIVNYNVVNRSASDPSCPSCSVMCGDLENCEKLDQKAREALCATAYCTSFRHSSGTENWAEMYRWYYQGSHTRDLLEKHFPACFTALDQASGINGGWLPPWSVGLGGVEGYRSTLWDSCGGRACRDY